MNGHLAWYFMDPLLPDSDAILGGMLGLAFSGKSMPGSGGVWCLFADGWDDVPALCGPAGRICRPGAPRQGAEAGYASDRNSPARIGRSWQAAVDISLAAQQVVPKSGSAFIQGDRAGGPRLGHDRRRSGNPRRTWPRRRWCRRCR